VAAYLDLSRYANT